MATTKTAGKPVRTGPIYQLLRGITSALGGFVLATVQEPPMMRGHRSGCRCHRCDVERHFDRSW